MIEYCLQKLKKYHTGQNSINLYATNVDRQDILNARGQCWNCVPQEHNAQPVRPITMLEIEDIINSLPKDKAPGDDGNLVEFYKATRETVAPDIFHFCGSTLSSGQLYPNLNRGMITLIPKQGDQSHKELEADNLVWHLYKILAKCLSVRLQKCLPDIICLIRLALQKPVV